MSATTKTSSKTSSKTTAGSRTRKSYSINALEDAVRILETVAETSGQVRLSQLSEALDLPKEKVFRVLATFEGLGYVEHLKATGTYRLGLSAYAIGQKFLSGMGLLREARPVINAVARELNEAVYCVVPVGDEVLFLDMVNTTERVAIMPLLGKRYPLDAVAAGRVIQAFGQGVDSQKGIEETRPGGACWDLGALGAGIASLAVPVIQGGGEVVGSLCLVAPEFRAGQQRLESRFLPELKRAGETISAKLGYLGKNTNAPLRFSL